MRRERDEAGYAHYFFPQSFKDKENILREMLTPCSRYASVLSLERKMQLYAARALAPIDPLQDVSKVLSSPIPYNWQTLLDYLHEKGLTSHRYPSFKRSVTDLPRSFNVQIEMKRHGSGTDGTNPDCSGYANSHDPEEALSKAIGEGLERYYSGLYRRDSFVRSSMDEMRKKHPSALDIAHLNDFLPWQKEKFPRYKRDDQALINWVQGTELFTGNRAYIPAQLVYWNYNFNHDKEEPILAQPTTNGCAGHFTRDEAILASLLESIQRDGFLIYWLNSLSPKIIEVGKIEDETVQNLLAEFKRYQLELYFLDTTTDIGVPSTTCVIVDRAGNEPVISIAGGTGFDLKSIIMHAAYETLVVHAHVRGLEPLQQGEDYEPFIDRAIGRTERLGMWKGEKMLKRLDFFLKGKGESPEEFMRGVSTQSPSEQLGFILGRLKVLGTGYEPYLYEFKNKVLDTVGYHVVRVIVPQLMHLYLNEHMPTLDAKRLREVPQKLSYTANTKVNRWPHPFP